MSEPDDEFMKKLIEMATKSPEQQLREYSHVVMHANVHHGIMDFPSLMKWLQVCSDKNPNYKP